MTVTSRSRRWEILHSLWIAWTFTIGFFSWVAFLYIGIRARQVKWIVSGVIYSIPFVLAMIFTGSPSFEGWVGDVTVGLTLLAGIVSLVHAFKARKEYLLRIDALSGEAGRKEAELKRRVSEEYEKEATEEVPQEAESSSSAPSRVPDNAQVETSKSPGNVDNVDTISSRGGGALKETTTVERSRIARQDLEGYPFPIAFNFGLLTSKWDPRDRYREQLRFAENILAFLASVSLALLYDRGGIEKTEIDPEAYWQGGISPGHWKDIAGRCSKVFEAHEYGAMADSIQNLNIRSEKRGFGKDIAALIKEKNDYKHDRGPVVDEDVIAASNEVQERLDRCVEALSFFTHHPIRLVQDFDVSRSREEFILKCLRYTGDGPGFPQEKITFGKALTRGDLFIDTGSEEWTPLHPFMAAMNCPRCKLQEIYSIDRWERKKGTAVLKSFERGHTEDSNAVSEALEKWAEDEER